MFGLLSVRRRKVSAAVSAVSVFLFATALTVNITQSSAMAQGPAGDGSPGDVAPNPTVTENSKPGDPRFKSVIAPFTTDGLKADDGDSPEPGGPVPGAPVVPTAGSLAGGGSDAISVDPNGFQANSTPNLRGYSSAESVNRGELIGLNISSATPRYVVEVFRTGWYGGMGARLVYTTTMTNGVLRSVPAPDINGKVDVGWPQSLAVDTSAFPSGAYMVVLSTEGATTASGLIPFIVREDTRISPILMQVPTQTWQAYDNFGGKSLYDANSTNSKRAYKVSLNRPYESGGGQSQFPGVYNLIRFLEREGYDVTYATSSDTDRDANLMNNHRVFLTGWHDEYWTGQMFTNALNWIAQGKHFVSLASNSIYWQTRYEDNRRTLVAYKDAALDPVTDPKQKTVLFRSAQVDRPESEITSSMFESSWDYGKAADWVVTNANHWMYQGTGLGEGSRITGLVGYEWDRFFDSSLYLKDLFNPRIKTAGVTQVSDSPMYNPSTNRNDPNRQQATIREQPNGAIIFNAGTNWWDFFLIGNPQYLVTPTAPAVALVEKITRNILNRAILTPATSSLLTPTPPARLLDTSGGPTVDGVGVGSPLAGGVVREVKVTGRAGVPGNAFGALVTLTVLNPANDGWVLAYQCGTPPLASNVNFFKGQNVTNTVIVPLSATGSVCVLSSTNTNLSVDVSGFSAYGSKLIANPPARLLDTRPGQSTVDGIGAAIGKPVAGGVVQVKVAGRGGLPNGISAALLNVVTVDANAPGYFSAYPCENTAPNASVLNYQPGQVVANTVLVPVGPSGLVCILTRASSHIVIDSLGAVPGGVGFVPGQPARLVDTRPGNVTIDGAYAGIGALGGDLTVNIGARGAVAGEGSGLYALNLTVTETAGPGALLVGPCDGTFVTAITFRAGSTVAGFALVKPNAARQICIRTTATTHVLVDRMGTVPVQ
jgi:hypothetical protein